MKFEQYLNEKEWNTATFSKVWKIELSTLRKIINNKGCPSLELALYIEQCTEKKVTTWDLCPSSDLIKKGRWSELIQKRKKKKKNKPTEEKDSHPVNVEG